MQNPNNFWKNYEFLCRKKGISIYDAAQKCGVMGRGTVSYWRRGSKPNAENLNNMTKFFDVTAYDLMYADLEAEELASRNAAVATNDPLYAAIAKLTPQQKQIVMAFAARLNANPNMPF